MKFVKTVVNNMAISMVGAAGAIIGLGVGSILMTEKIEPWMNKKLHKDSN